MPAPPRTPPETLPEAIGRYQVRRVIGQGAMGRVLLAHDPVLGRDVAVKHLRDDLPIPREVREALFVRMQHEARAAARVAHPNLVTLHDLGEDEQLGLYLVFEYAEGPTLKEEAMAAPLAPGRVARLVRELGVGLSLAHAAGVVHRDVKPENIILTRSGAKIADFGIARIPDSTLTHQGGLMGTPAYSAPETFRAGTFSAASDQFSLAASVYEALSGKRAFPGEDAVAVASRIATDRPAPIAAELGIAATVDAVLSRGMAVQPGDRFPSCEAFGEALAQSLGEGAPEPSAGLEATPEAAAAEAHHVAAHPATAPAPPSATAPAPPSARAPREATEGSPPPPSPRPVARATAVELPRERKAGQVALGGAVVVVTAALLLRTALHSAESPADAPVAQAKASATAASSAPARPRAPLPPKPRPPRADPGGDAGATPAPSGAPVASADAPAPSGPAASSLPGDAGVAPATAVPSASAVAAAVSSARPSAGH